MASTLWPNGEPGQMRSVQPGSRPSGAVATARKPQHAQRPPNKRTRVTSGQTGGSSMRS